MNDLFDVALRDASRPMLQGPFTPPEGEINASFDDKVQQSRDDAYFAVMFGDDCAFWPRNYWRSAMDRPEYDDEQELRLFVAIRKAVMLIGADDVDRWRVIESALREEANRYADKVADRVMP